MTVQLDAVCFGVQDTDLVGTLACDGSQQVGSFWSLPATRVDDEGNPGRIVLEDPDGTRFCLLAPAAGR